MNGFAVAIAVLFLSGGASFAGNAATPPPARHAAPTPFPCAAAYKKFCAAVPMGNGRRVLCLAQHEAELTPTCKPLVKAMLAMYNQGVEQHRRTLIAVQRRMEAEKNEKAGSAKNKPAASPQKTSRPPPSSPPAH